MNVLTTLRALAGVSVIAVGVWLFVSALPTLDFGVLVLFLTAGIFVIEAPRFFKLHRQRRERIAAYVETNESAGTVADRVHRFRHLGWIPYGLAIIWVFTGHALLGPRNFAVIFGIALALIAVGFAFSLYRLFVETSVDFRSLSATKPTISQARLWIITIGLVAIVLLAFATERIWSIDAVNWLFGIIAVVVVGTFSWRWLRGWPTGSDPP